MNDHGVTIAARQGWVCYYLRAKTTEATTVGLEEVCGGREAMVGAERISDLEDQDAAQAARAEEAAGMAVSVFTTVVGAGVSAATSGAAAPLVWSVGSTLARPLLVEELAPETAAELDNPAAGDPGLIEACAYEEAVNKGLVPREALTPEVFIDPDTCEVDPATGGPDLSTGQPYSWYNQPASKKDPLISLPHPPGADTIGEIRGWAMSEEVAEADEDDVLGTARSRVTIGASRARDIINGGDSAAGGVDGRVTIDKG